MIGKPHAKDRAQELRNQLLACKRALFHWGMGRTRIEYRVLHGLGAKPDEILETLLQATMGDLPSTTFILAMNLQGNLSLDTLRGILNRYGIHPLSLALHLEDQPRAQTLLRRLGLAEVYGRWIGPGGLLIRGEADLKALPPGLIINGDARIEDCPELVDLGEGLVVTMGTLMIQRCPKLQRLPDGLTSDRDGNITLLDCPEFEHLGAAMKIEGTLLVERCPKFRDERPVKR